MSTTEEPRAPTAWHADAPAGVLSRLGTTEGGLSSREAAARLARHGPNRLPRIARPSALELLLGELRNPLIYPLLLSAAVAIALGNLEDSLVVLAVVVLNALIGFGQEYRAGRAIAALAALMEETARVRRDGQWVEVEAEQVVPGDVVAVAQGERVLADLRLLEAQSLHTREAALTGESAPVDKRVTPAASAAPLAERHRVLYAGTVHGPRTPEREVDLARAGGAGATNPEAIVELLRAGVLCNDAPSNVGRGASLGDPTETALLAAAELCGVDPVRERAAKPRVAAIPFDAERRLMATLNRVPEGRTALYVKGAPEVVLELCPRAERVAVEQAVDRIAAAGQRVLMFAVRRDPPAGELEEALEELELLRLQAMIDPPRAEATDAVAACRRAGVRVLMITGDHGATARAIGTASGPPSA